MANISSATSPKSRRRSFREILESDGVVGYVFILPFVLGFLIFTLYPVIASFYYSLTSYNILSAPRFIGFKNYSVMFTMDSKFWKTMQVTFIYVFISVPLRLAFALAVAMLFTYKTKLDAIYRAVYYVPSLIGGSVAIAVLWQRLFGDNGIMNLLLGLIGINSTTNWLGNPDTSLSTVIILAVWQFGSSMLIFLAGLKQIPASYYEAADIDSASPWKKFTNITLPMLTPVIFFNLIMQLINGFMSFTQAFIISHGNGQPLDSLLLYSLYLYNQAFGYYKMGYGCALAWVMLIIIAIFTGVLFKSSNSWVYYENKGGD
jgi:multiple sugar transport system permease protein